MAAELLWRFPLSPPKGFWCLRDQAIAGVLKLLKQQSFTSCKLRCLWFPWWGSAPARCLGAPPAGLPPARVTRRLLGRQQAASDGEASLAQDMADPELIGLGVQKVLTP